MPTPTPPLRGRRGRDRRIAERVATDFAARHARPTREALDFDVAEVDREVEDEERHAAAPAARVARPAGPTRPPPTGQGQRPSAARTCPRCRHCWPGRARSPRSVERLGRPDGPTLAESGGTWAGVGPARGQELPGGGPRARNDRRAAGLDRPRRGDRRPGGRGARRLARRRGGRVDARAADIAGLRAK